MNSSISNLMIQLTAHRQLIILMMMAGAMGGFVYRWIASKVFVGSIRGSQSNIGTYDRILRAVACILLFGRAITTTFSPVLLFASGFCLFEAIFSWCGLYTALGKNSCPIR